MFTRIIFWLLLVLCPILSHADELTAQKENDVRKLIVSTGGTKIGVQFASAITENLSMVLKKARPDIPERVFTVLNKELITLFEEKMNAPGGMVEQVIPIYAKYFTHSEIKELLAFYQTSIGRKAVDVLPKVVGESMVAGQAWGESLAPEINRRVEATLKREGIEMPRR
jgi:hypothetical protein